MLDDDDYEDDEEADDEEEEGEDEPSTVFVGMAFGRDGCEGVFDIIDGVCDALDLSAVRAHPDQIVGSPAGDEVVHALLDSADFAIIDLTHERPSVAHEIGMADRELDRAFILLIAKAGTPRFANIQGRTINYYADAAELRKIVKRQLTAMIDAWHESDEDDQDDGDDEED